jgi:arylsulfatase A-like enzyme
MFLMRPSLLPTTLVICAIAYLSGGACAAVQSGDRRPNILFIYTDDQSYKTLSCYDGAPEWVKTPQIDRLAARGVRFERSYLGAWCMPSRASILTGRLQHAVMSMTMVGEYPGSTYDPTLCPFVPAQFRKQGCQTAQIGKWHTGTDTGFDRDWDFQIVWNRIARPENGVGEFYYTNQILTFNGKDRLVEGYATDNYTNWAVEYINGQHRNSTKPWYLWLCYSAIHPPTTPANRHKGKLAGKKAAVPADILGPWPDKPAYLKKTKAWVMTPDGKTAQITNAMKAGKADARPGRSYEEWIQQANECTAAVDEGVGRLLDALETSGQVKNTLVVFASDQGFAIGEHGFRQKVAPYDATLASPLIISWPGQIPEDRVCREPVNAPDLVDFFCRTAGVSVPWKMHGRDIRPLLANPETTEWNSPMLMTHTARSYGVETDEIPTDGRLTSASDVPWYVLLRDRKYKYIRNLVAGETEELYDLEADPEELVNLAVHPGHASRLRELRAKTIAELRRTDAKFFDRMPPTKAEG